MPSSRAAFWSVACAIALRAVSVAAQVAPPPAPWPQAAPPPAVAPAEPTVERWYGWQTLLADTGVLTLAIGLGGAVDERDEAAVIGAVVAGVGAFALAGPIVHAAHGHWRKAGGSLALRGGLLLLGGALGYAIGEESCGQYVYDHEGCGIGEGAAGLVIGGVLAIIADSAILARDQVPLPARPAPAVTFTPLRGGGGLALFGRF